MILLLHPRGFRIHRREYITNSFKPWLIWGSVSKQRTLELLQSFILYCYISNFCKSRKVLFRKPFCRNWNRPKLLHVMYSCHNLATAQGYQVQSYHKWLGLTCLPWEQHNQKCCCKTCDLFSSNTIQPVFVGYIVHAPTTHPSPHFSPQSSPSICQCAPVSLLYLFRKKNVKTITRNFHRTLTKFVLLLVYQILRNPVPRAPHRKKQPRFSWTVRNLVWS